MASVKLFLWGTHHHLTELIEVHGSTTIFIQLINDAVEFICREGSEQLAYQLSQSVHCNEPLTFFVIETECILQFSLHGFNIWVFHKKLSTQLTKLSKFNLTRTIFINLLQNVHQLFLARSKTHGSKNLIEI